METSYFGAINTHSEEMKGKKIFCISHECPEGVKAYKKLVPTWDIINLYKDNGDIVGYIEAYYDKILNKLNPKEIYEELKDAVIVCYEKSNEFCHRHIVSYWIKRNVVDAEVNELFVNEEDVFNVYPYMEKVAIKHKLKDLSFGATHEIEVITTSGCIYAGMPASVVYKNTLLNKTLTAEGIIDSIECFNNQIEAIIVDGIRIRLSKIDELNVAGVKTYLKDGYRIKNILKTPEGETIFKNDKVMVLTETDAIYKGQISFENCYADSDWNISIEDEFSLSKQKIILSMSKIKTAL